MDRLTNIGTKGELYITDNDETRHIGQKEAAYAKLKEYEDIEESGLLVRLPCKVGDTLYTNQMVQGWYLREANRPFTVDVCFIGINGQDNFFNVDYRCGYMSEFKFSDIGKTIFFTKEKAEQVLKEARKK